MTQPVQTVSIVASSKTKPNKTRQNEEERKRKQKPLPFSNKFKLYITRYYLLFHLNVLIHKSAYHNAFFNENIFFKDRTKQEIFSLNLTIFLFYKTQKYV
jgi:hypothetical protein